ncbi:hypothetical protein MES4922_40156 [Mesorhizobium ventifaucium]|uniref:Uncharacterized protein n=1 Tax=Mesorhizobium ventifaucium TaxID=666020 RepID=A0ABN8K771_9HYPH|nr:hypothetical protein MES4922_40156 [Mesorhizobium ventifaucium]
MPPPHAVPFWPCGTSCGETQAFAAPSGMMGETLDCMTAGPAVAMVWEGGSSVWGVTGWRA